MRNYIILNDVNSNTINGLLIQELPPISKPKMRTQIEEIDGRAGDIVTQLGYAAYTKTISVGLYGDFDINEVISYFNSSGTVVFSNEPDKYYNYEIIDQIDFNRLVRFRTAKVKMHVQPFKYPTEEEPLVAQYQLVTNTGSNMSLDNTANALFRKLDLKGNTSQTGTPTPDAPVNVDVVSGDNVLSICGKNRINIPNGTYSNHDVTAVVNNGVITLNGTANGTSYININLGNNVSVNGEDYTYSISNTATSSVQARLFDTNNSYVVAYTTTTNYKITKNDTRTYNMLSIVTTSGVSLDNFVIKPQLENGNTNTTFEPYIGQDYPIYLPVENLLDLSQFTTQGQDGITFTKNSDGSITINGTATNNITLRTPITPITLQGGTTYTLSKGTTYSGANYSMSLRKQDQTVISDTSIDSSASSVSFTPSSGVQAYYFQIYIVNGKTFNNHKVYPMVEKGNKENHFVKYGTTPIEFHGIGDYKDKPFKAVVGDETYDSLTDAQKEGLTIGNWYVYKVIGKYIFPSNTHINSMTGGYFIYISNMGGLSYIMGGYNTKFKYVDDSRITDNNAANYYLTNNQMAFRMGSSKDRLYFKTDLSSTDLQDALADTPLFYVLATPTFPQITDEDLIAQLEALKQANSCDGQTNISHEYNGSPFILDVAAVQKGSDILVVDNEGNIYARPTLDIEGTGMVNVYLEGNQMFQVDLSENNEIVIDTNEMEAYDPSTQALMNRQVTGNYDNFKIVAGNNNLKFSGDLTKATVTNYERWL